MATKSALINVMIAAAEKAAPQMIRDFGEVEQLQVSKKGPSDFVSAADLKAEGKIRKELEKARPKFGFLLEERGEIKGQDPTQRWIVDPLDGTTNFLHGIPHFAISIALEMNGEIIAGVIFDPIKNELFWAEKGQGAFMNHKRLRVSSRGDMSEAVVATGIPHHGRGDHGEFLAIAETMMARTSGVRRFGAAALDIAYVAAGRYEAFWELDLKYWDIAAGMIILREAGGFLTDYSGRDRARETGEVLATNAELHNDMSRLITDIRKERAKKAS